jgi:hypothetical protein
VMGNPEKRYDPGAAEDVEEEEDIGLEDNIMDPSTTNATSNTTTSTGGYHKHQGL